ncbi:MAG: protein-L-isoaspartate O-methyltransferase [Pseudomonadota bacterium]
MDTAKARQHMVDSQVRPNSVTSIPLQSAMARIPRERFVPADRKNIAYAEKDLSLFEGRWLLKPRDFSKLINDAHIKTTDIVLDVACGYGYSSAVIAAMAEVVVGLEEESTIVDGATERLASLNLENAVVVEGSLADGYAKQAPYDVIIIAGGVEAGLDPLLAQLNPDGGRLATIIQGDRVSTATLFTRSGNAVGERALFEAHPAGLIPAFKAPPQFRF